jgi:hypothetical protein
MRISMLPDRHSLQNPAPSNIAETVTALVEQIHAEEDFKLNVTANSDVVLKGVEAGKMKLHMAGGVLRVFEHTDVPNMGRDIAIDATDATVEFNMHRRDMVVAMDDISQHTTSIAGATVTQQPSSSGFQYFVSKTGGISGVTDRMVSNATQVALSSRHSSVFLLSADHEHMTNKDLKLETVRGPLAAGKARLLRDGELALQNLRTWLKAHGTEKYVIYLHMLHPHAPAGTLRLLSTAAYRAFSLPEFALATAGMLSPQLARIQTPVLGLPKFFPRRPCDPPLTEEDIKAYSQEIFEIVEDQGILNLWVCYKHDTCGIQLVLAQIISLRKYLQGVGHLRTGSDAY